MSKTSYGMYFRRCILWRACSAADMALKAPPPPAPVYSWTGCYVGGNGGGVGAPMCVAG